MDALSNCQGFYTLKGDCVKAFYVSFTQLSQLLSRFPEDHRFDEGFPGAVFYSFANLSAQTSDITRLFRWLAGIGLVLVWVSKSTILVLRREFDARL